jgi:hypothetical protein
LGKIYIMWEKLSKQSIRNTLSVITIIGAFIFLFFVAANKIPSESKDVVLTLGGVMFGSGVTAVYGFNFGSSKDVAKKD